MDATPQAVAMQPTGEIVVAGTTAIDTKLFVRAYKANGPGVEDWTYIDPNEGTHGRHLTISTFGRIHVAGHLGYSDADARITTLDPAGNVEWVELYDSGPDSDDSAYRVATAPGLDNIVVLVHVAPIPDEPRAGWLGRYALDGELLAGDVFPVALEYPQDDVAVSSFEDIAVVGVCFNGSDRDIYVGAREGFVPP